MQAGSWEGALEMVAPHMDKKQAFEESIGFPEPLW